MAHWLKDRPEVDRYCTPPCPTAPATTTGRSSQGLSGLFSFTLRDIYQERSGGVLDGMDIFSMGATGRL
jgi:cystathionine beta-lyase/cystathionine gamma-synthase